MATPSDYTVARRRYAPKSRGGCSTCKSRHVRCDQKRPRCGACRKSSRQCEYVLDPSGGGRSSAKPGIKVIFWEPTEPSLSTQRLARNPGQSADQYRALRYFRDVVAIRLAGYFDPSFWTGLAFQVAQTVASSRHAMIALASFWENVIVPGSTKRSTADWECDTFTLQQYTIAITEVRKSMELASKPPTVELLLSNLLFIALEMFQNHYESALRQLSSGLYLFCEWQTKQQGPNCPSPGKQDETRCELEVQISHIYKRMMTQSLLFPAKRFDQRLLVPWLTPKMPQIPDELQSLEQARNLLNDCVSSMLHKSLTGSSASSESSPGQDESPNLLHAVQSAHLRKWSEAFELFRTREQENFSQMERRNCIVLEMQRIAAHIWSLAPVNASEMDFDRWMPEFSKMAALGSYLADTKHHVIPDGRIYPKFDAGLILPMYVVATSCRHPEIRRQAVDLLRRGPRQEAVWNGAMLASVAERIIAIEEEGVESVKDCVDIPTHARIKLVDATIYSTERKLGVTFRRSSSGGEQQFELLHEIIPYSS